MASPTNGYSREPMSRMQYLMLLAVEHGASLDDAADCALAWGPSTLSRACSTTARTQAGDGQCDRTVWT